MAMLILATPAAATPLPAGAGAFPAGRGGCPQRHPRHVGSSSSASSDLLQRQGGGRDAIYVAAMPLRATAGPAQTLASVAYSLRLWDLQHFMVIIERCGAVSSERRATVFDFQPRDPENVFVLLSALSRKAVPGITLKRTLNRMPKNRCWFVGFSKKDGVKVADEFNEDWDTDLVVGIHDCRHYTTGLVKQLTGKVKPKKIPTLMRMGTTKSEAKRTLDDDNWAL
ncbi:hypothetical protein Taro_039408 [Colocasia esculenta]|uniref:Uncharacterized protein n=1 Tax=Colocasia esculenta TaxID=4460 RepID=A0A843WM50_COLES|nr:hypothetical protein [Colocasia esculenta]